MCGSANSFELGLVSGSLNCIATNEPQGRGCIVDARLFFLFRDEVLKLEVGMNYHPLNEI